MPSLRAHAISFAFTDSRPLFSDLSFQLEPGLTALVGENGAGKTTLLRLLSGELMPTSGHLQMDASTRVLATQLSSADPPHTDELIAEPGFHRILGQLRLDLDELAVGHAFIRRAQALADRGRARAEPTNHLDLPWIERLETALAQWPGALVLVTHDERLAARTRRGFPKPLPSLSVAP